MTSLPANAQLVQFYIVENSCNSSTNTTSNTSESSNVATGTINLSWNTPTTHIDGSNVGEITGYLITITNSGTNEVLTFNESANVNTLSIPGVPYNYSLVTATIQAIDANSALSSNLSTQSMVFGPNLSAPTNIQATTGITLVTWSDVTTMEDDSNIPNVYNGQNVTGVEYYVYSGGMIQNQGTPIQGTSFNVGLTGGQPVITVVAALAIENGAVVARSSNSSPAVWTALSAPSLSMNIGSFVKSS